MIGYAWRDLVRNPRRTLAALTGVMLGVGLFSGVLFFVDGSGATMTARAVAPLTLDIQRIVTAEPTDLRLSERISGADALGGGDRAMIEITATNGGAAAANDVVIQDEPPRRLRYLPETTTLDGTHQPDIDGDSPLSHGIAGFGMTIGRLDAGASVTITYAVEATEAVLDVGSLPMRATVSSREQEVPIAANAPPVVMLDELLSRIAAIPGVAAVDALGMVDLPPGALAAKGTGVGEPSPGLRVRSALPRSLPVDPDRLGSARELGSLAQRRGGSPARRRARSEIELAVPGRASSLRLPVTGTVDLAQAQPLFSSRKASKLEEFLYVPNVVVISPATFRDVVVPAFDRARATVGTSTKSFPVVEADVLLDRGPLEADPATALAQTSAVTAAIDRIGPGQGYVIDNISNALAVASVDAATGRRMFLFLGLPGALLAAFLAAFAASILAATERREQAIASRSWRRPPAPANDRAHEVTRDRVRRIDRRYRARPALDGDRPRRDHRVRGDDRRTHPVRDPVGHRRSRRHRRRAVRPRAALDRTGSQRTTAGTPRRALASVAEVRSRCRARGRGGGPGDRRGSGRCPRSTGWVGVLRDRDLLADEPAVDPRPRVGGRVAPVRTAPRRPRIARARAGAPFRTGRSRCLGSEPSTSRGRSRWRHPRAWPRRSVRNGVGVVRRDVRCSEGRRRAVHPGLRHPDHAERPRDRSTERRRCVRVPRSRRRRGVARRLRRRERGHDRAAQPATREPRGDRPLDLLGGRAVARSGLRRGDRGGHAGRVGRGPARGPGG